MKTVKILMIEDQSHFAEMVVHLLEGLDIDVVGTLNAAKERLATKRYGLVLVDLGLPDSQGLDTLRALKGFKVPMVVLTARFDLSEGASTCGAIDYVVKTTEMSDLYERLMFNVSKVRKPKLRFAPDVFSKLQECLQSSAPAELTLVH